ncbi:MAG: PQQ-binding-like beta-propeller repeat protein [Patescibacteria group bacterium]
MENLPPQQNGLPVSKQQEKSKKKFYKKWWFWLVVGLIFLVSGLLVFWIVARKSILLDYGDSKFLPSGEITGPIAWDKIADLYFEKKDVYAPLSVDNIVQCEGGPQVIYQLFEGCCGGPRSGYPLTYDNDFNIVSESWIDRHADEYVCTSGLLDDALIRAGYAVDSSFYNILVDGDTLFVGTNYHTVQALQRSTGEVLWETAIDSYQRDAMLQDDQRLYIPIDKYSMVALEKTTGKQVWQQEDIVYSTGIAPGKRQLGSIKLLASGNLLMYNAKEKLGILVDSVTGDQLADLPTFEGNYSDAPDVLYYWYPEYENVAGGGQLTPTPVKYYMATVNPVTGDINQTELALGDADPKDVHVFAAKDDAKQLYIALRDRQYNWEIKQNIPRTKTYAAYTINPTDGSINQLWNFIDTELGTTFVWGEAVYHQTFYIRNKSELQARDLQTGVLEYTVDNVERDSCVRSNSQSAEILCLYTVNHPGFYDDDMFNISNSGYMVSGDYFIYYNTNDSDVIDNFITVYNSEEEKLWSETFTGDTKLSQVDMRGKYLVVKTTVARQSKLEIRDVATGEVLMTLPNGDMQSIGVYDDIVYVIDRADENGSVHSINLRGNNLRWSAPIGRPLADSELSR